MELLSKLYTTIQQILFPMLEEDKFGFEGQPWRRKYQGQRKQQGFLPSDVWRDRYSSEADV
jgi:hypothetical protein